MRGNPPPACSPVRRPRKGRSRRIFLPGAGQRRHKARGPAFARRTFRQSPAEPGRGLHEAPFPPRFPRPSQTPSSLRFSPAQSGPWRQKRALFSAAHGEHAPGSRGAAGHGKKRLRREKAGRSLPYSRHVPSAPARRNTASPSSGAAVPAMEEKRPACGRTHGLSPKIDKTCPCLLQEKREPKARKASCPLFSGLPQPLFF